MLVLDPSLSEGFFQLTPGSVSLLLQVPNDVHQVLVTASAHRILDLLKMLQKFFHVFEPTLGIVSIRDGSAHIFLLSADQIRKYQGEAFHMAILPLNC